MRQQAKGFGPRRRCLRRAYQRLQATCCRRHRLLLLRCIDKHKARCSSTASQRLLKQHRLCAASKGVRIPGGNTCAASPISMTALPPLLCCSSAAASGAAPMALLDSPGPNEESSGMSTSRCACCGCQNLGARCFTYSSATCCGTRVRQSATCTQSDVV